MQPELANDPAMSLTTSIPLIELHGVSKVYGKGLAAVHALRGIDMAVSSGEFVAMMGPSGSGKSTCMNILGCLDSPTQGDYLFDGVAVGSLSRNQLALLRRHYIGFVFQGFNLLARTTALENVELPLIYRGVPVDKRHALARECEEHEQAQPHQRRVSRGAICSRFRSDAIPQRSG